MRLYLAGGVPTKFRIFNAGDDPEDSMGKLYLAGTTFWRGGGCLDNGQEDGFDREMAARVNLLESFYYIAEWQTANLHHFKSFMLDSGAYTFAYGSGAEHIDWDEYLKEYAAYINDNDVELFFELDIDKLVGYQRVLELRKKLEEETGRRCIPVWHLNRGYEDWLETCEKYDYIALGGLAAREFGNQEKVIPWFTSTAHERDCMVHGLGYTKLPYLARMGFDSVDSSAWLYGNRGGFIYRYRGGYVMDKAYPPEDMRVDARATARHNFTEWVKLAEEMER